LEYLISFIYLFRYLWFLFEILESTWWFQRWGAPAPTRPTSWPRSHYEVAGTWRVHPGKMVEDGDLTNKGDWFIKQRWKVGIEQSNMSILGWFGRQTFEICWNLWGFKQSTIFFVIWILKICVCNGGLMCEDCQAQTGRWGDSVNLGYNLRDLPTMKQQSSGT
jgi:hypothetical protein